MSQSRPLRDSDVTPRELYQNRPRAKASRLWTRRDALATLALATGAAACSSPAGDASESGLPATLAGFDTAGPNHNLGAETPAPKEIPTTYNNFYEFGTGKTEPAENAPDWSRPTDWSIAIGGEVSSPKQIALADILKMDLEERIYRMRCVEGWSYVVPWIGVPLRTVLNQLQPTGNAKYVAFESYYDDAVMLGYREAGIEFPYVEGLRIDEAMHPLTLLAVGMYGETLPNQNGAPIRLVVPWKYGFKGIKSIARITFTEQPPPTTWNKSWPGAYGFYSNVNPERDHPGWSQATEDRLDGSGALGQGRMIATQKFNGYGDQVAHLYSGMDLIQNY